MSQASARTVALEHRKLLTESQVLDDEVAAGADSRPKCAEEAEEDGGHHVMMLEVGRRLLPACRHGERRVPPSLPPSVRWVMPMGFWRTTADAALESLVEILAHAERNLRGA